jgi:hypothetical protein
VLCAAAAELTAALAAVLVVACLPADRRHLRGWQGGRLLLLLLLLLKMLLLLRGKPLLLRCVIPGWPSIAPSLRRSAA